MLSERQEFLQRVLVQERVAAGEQHAVEVAGLKEAHGRVSLVEAKAHRLDHTLAPQLVHSSVGTLHGLAEALVRQFEPVGPHVHVVQEQDVDAGKAEPHSDCSKERMVPS